MILLIVVKHFSIHTFYLARQALLKKNFIPTLKPVFNWYLNNLFQ